MTRRFFRSAGVPALASILLCILATLIPGALSAGSGKPDRAIQIANESGKRIELYWIHANTGERVLTSDPHIFNGATFNLNSFVTHTFEVRELPGSKTGECGDVGSPDKTCRVGFFTVNENDDQVIYVRKGMEVEHTDNKSIARGEATDLLSACREEARKSLDGDDATPEAAASAIDQLVACVESSVASTLEKSNEEISFQRNVRVGMADLLENYTCADEGLNTTEEIDTKRWYSNGVQRTVKVLHDRPASKIHIVENFISEEECEAMERAAEPKLHKATVADGKGGSELSKNRKAMQAGIKVPWRLEGSNDPIARLSRRVYDYVNHVLGLAIEEHGQEDLMSIQYFGRGESEEEPDRYMPHCDGDCTGLPHKTGNRMATMVMYCTVPERGGATNFKNAGLHIVPKKGSATFFSYINPKDFKMDTGFTEHSGCPVIKGEKKIVTQWVRLGVDKENPWDSFNTLGIKNKDAEDQ